MRITYKCLNQDWINYFTVQYYNPSITSADYNSNRIYQSSNHWGDQKCSTLNWGPKPSLDSKSICRVCNPIAGGSNPIEILI